MKKYPSIKNILLSSLILSSSLFFFACGGGSESPVPTPPEQVSLSLNPVKGPFKQATIRAYGLKDSKNPATLSLTMKKPFSSSIHTAEVELPKADLTLYDKIVFAFSNIETGGDLLKDGSLSPDLQIDSFFFTSPANPSLENTTLSADIFDHLGTVAALKSSGVTTDNLKIGTVSAMENFNDGIFTNAEYKTKNQILSSVTGGTKSNISGISPDERKTVSTLMIAGMLNAAETAAPLSAFRSRFSALSAAIATATPSNISLLLTTDSTGMGFIKPLSQSEANIVTAALSASGEIKGILDSSSVYNAESATMISDFSDTNFSLKLENFVRTIGRYESYYNITVSLNNSQNQSAGIKLALLRDETNFKLLPDPDLLTEEKKKSLQSQVMAVYNTDTPLIELSTLSAGSSFRTTHITTISVSFGSLNPIKITSPSSGVIPETTSSTLQLPLFVSEVPAWLTTPTNDSGSIDVSSNHGIWLATSSNLRTASATVFFDSTQPGGWTMPMPKVLLWFNHNTQYYLKAADSYQRLGCELDESRGHDGLIFFYVGQDFISDAKTYYTPSVTDLSKTEGAVYLSPGNEDSMLTSIESKKMQKALAHASLPFCLATTELFLPTEQNPGWRSIPRTERLSANVRLIENEDGLKTGLLVSAPMLSSMANPGNPKIDVLTHRNERLKADAGLRNGLYGLTISAGGIIPSSIPAPDWPEGSLEAGIVTSTDLRFTALFSVDEDGQVWSHGGMGETTSELMRYRNEKIGINSAFTLPITSSTFGYFGRRQVGSWRSGRAIAGFSDDSAAKSAFSSLLTTDITISLFALLRYDWSDSTILSANLLLKSENNGSEAILLSTGTSATLLVSGDACLLDNITPAKMPGFLLATPSDNIDSNEKSGFYLTKNTAGLTRQIFLTNPAEPTINYTDSDVEESGSPSFMLPEISEIIKNSRPETSAGINRMPYYGFELLKPFTRVTPAPRNIADGNHSLEAYFNPFYPPNNSCDELFGGIYLGTSGTIALEATSATIRLTGSENIKVPAVTLYRNP